MFQRIVPIVVAAALMLLIAIGWILSTPKEGDSAVIPQCLPGLDCIAAVVDGKIKVDAGR